MQGAKKSSLSLGGPHFVLKNTTSAEVTPDARGLVKGAAPSFSVGACLLPSCLGTLWIHHVWLGQKGEAGEEQIASLTPSPYSSASHPAMGKFGHQAT